MCVATDQLVSCIIIFFNEEKYLGEAIESVIAQSYNNWELLLIDDGSTDRSEAISRPYCERYPGKIRYLTHDSRENRGMSASRNLGLRHARGEFAAFLDGDDWWYPDKLERQIALFDKHPRAIMVCGATLYWHSWKTDADSADRIMLVGQWNRSDGSTVLALEQDRLFERGELMRRLYPLGRGATPSSSGNMFRRDMAVAVGGYDESFRGLFEDQVFRAKTYLHGAIFVSHEVFDRYRQHAESCFHVAKVTGQSEHARHQLLQWLTDYLDKVGCRDRLVHWQLRRRKLRHEFPLIRRLWSNSMTLIGRVGGRR